MAAKAWNWRLWVGFALCLAAPFGYFSLFEATRLAPWIGAVGFVVGIGLLVGGLRRTFAAPESHRGKIAGPILATLSLLVIGLFSFGVYSMHRAYPAAHNAPRVGDKAPVFALADGNDSQVTLAKLLAASLPNPAGGARTPRGVLLVFFRGYW